MASRLLRIGILGSCVLAAFATGQLPTAAAAQTAASVSNPPPAGKQLAGKTCLSVSDAAGQPNKDICVSAHVFDVIQLTDGTRFLDVCPSDVSDEECRFTLISLREDRDDVGDLRRYRNQDIHVRGIVHATHGRMGIVISHMRQFQGGPEKFKPNPRLLRGFNGQSDRAPVRDPNLASAGHHRSFMNTRDTEQLPSRPAR